MYVVKIFLFIALILLACLQQIAGFGEKKEEKKNDFLMAGLETLAETSRDPEKLKEVLSDLQDPEVLRQVKAMMNDPEFKEQVAQMQNDPRFKQYMQSAKSMVNTPEFKETIAESAEAMKQMIHEDPKLNVQLGLSEMAKAAQDPKILAEAMQMMKDPEVMKEVQKMMSDPTFKAEMKKYTDSASFQNAKASVETTMDGLAQDPVKLKMLEAQMAALMRGEKA